MDDNVSFHDMLTDLRTQFNRRIPGGLTVTADQRLDRTLNHYIKEVGRVGQGGTRDVLRLTYDSMVKWIRRSPPATSLPPIDERFTTEMDQDSVFAAIKAARTQPEVQQKDVLQPHQDTIKYREVEYNLVMNSKDRDWLNNTAQNRYNFEIQFNTNYKTQGFGLQGTIQNRLRNITRLEFIKAILPVEGLSVVVTRDCSHNAVAPQNAFYSVLALPSVTVLVDEFQGNNYGTNNDIEKSLAVCQYDATWRSENVWNKPGVNRGYTLFFPKFMKAQRVYSPTPLSNLQSLSFRLNDPEGNLLSKLPDSSVLGSIAFSTDVSGSCYSDPSGGYIFLQTQDFFPLWSYSQLDKILLQNVETASPEMTMWLQDSAGHSVVGAAYTLSNTPLTVIDGFNDVGYANWIIISNRYSNPTSGNTAVNPFLPNETVLAASYPPNTGGILNLSRQVQLYIRIITREYDLNSNIRADNV